MVDAMKKSRLFWAALAVVLAAGTLFAIPALTDPYGCRMAPGTSVGGLDLGGLTRSQARKALATEAEELLLTQPLEIRLPEQTLILTPEEAGLELSARKAVKDAYRYGRKEDAVPQLGLMPYLTVNSDAIRAVLQTCADAYDTSLTQPSWELVGDAPPLSTDVWTADAPCQELRVTLGIPELHLDVDGILDQILRLYDQPFAAEGWLLTPDAEPEALPEDPDWAAIAGEVCVKAENDSLDLTTYGFVRGSYGYAFSQADARALAAQAGYGDVLSLPMTYTAPEILGEAAYFRDVLGTCETKHNDNENRNTNLQLLCEALDGLVIQPGEEFSYNAAVGERTPERGYKPAPAYSGNRLIQDYGGGVCQGSTTLYNCLLLADMEITARVCHGATVSYVPLGLDAAVNWNTNTDLAFRNNSHFPVKIQAEVSDGYVKMKLLGTDEKDYYIKMETRSGDDEYAIYAASYKCKYDKETDELISREVESRSTYYKDLG